MVTVPLFSLYINIITFIHSKVVKYLEIYDFYILMHSGFTHIFAHEDFYTYLAVHLSRIWESARSVSSLHWMSTWTPISFCFNAFTLLLYTIFCLTGAVSGLLYKIINQVNTWLIVLWLPLYYLQTFLDNKPLEIETKFLTINTIGVKNKFHISKPWLFRLCQGFSNPIV